MRYKTRHPHGNSQVSLSTSELNFHLIPCLPSKYYHTCLCSICHVVGILRVRSCSPHANLYTQVIWLNEKAEDFVLYGALEKAFFRNHRKLDVSCIVERDLFGHQLGDNANVQESAPDFKIGTLAAISGASGFCSSLASTRSLCFFRYRLGRTFAANSVSASLTLGHSRPGAKL